MATPWLEPSTKLTFVYWEPIDGHDSDLDPTLAPVADPALFGGFRALASAGLDITPDSKWVRGWTLSTEMGVPFYQNLNGPQPGQEWQLMCALSHAL